MDKVLRLAPLEELATDWANTLRRWRDRHPGRTLLTVVPSPAAAATLRRWAPDLAAYPHLQMMDWATLLTRTMTSVALPEQASTVLAAHCPPSVTGLPADIPGLYDIVIETALECRRAGLTRQRLQELGVPWAATLDWLNDVLGPPPDERQAYQYAWGTRDAPAGVGFFALAEVPPAPAARLARLAAGAPAVHWLPWTPATAPAVRGSRSWWRRQGFWPQPLGGRQREPRASAIIAADAAEAMAVVWQEAMAGPAPTAVVLPSVQWLEDWPAAPPPLAGDAGWRFEHTAEARRWQWFWRVASGRARKPEVLLWLERQAEVGTGETLGRRARRAGGHWRQAVGDHAALAWAQRWYAGVSGAGRWAEVAGGVQAACERLWPAGVPAVVASWLEELARHQVFDALGLYPTPSLVEALLARPRAPLGGSPAAEGGHPVAYLGPSAIFHGLPRLVVAGPGEAPPIAETASPRLLDRRQERALGLAAPAASSRRRRYRWALLWAWVREGMVVTVGEPSGWPTAGWTPTPGGGETIAPPAVDERRSAVEAWYRSRSQTAWTAYDGAVGPWLSAAAPIPVTATALERFGRCPLQYFFAEVLGLKAAPDPEPMEVEAALWGQWAHAALARLTAEGAAPTREAVAQAVEAAWRSMPPPPSVPLGVLRAAVALLVEDLAEAWRRLMADGGAGGEAERALATSEAGLAIAVRLDRLERTPHGIRVVDFKTGEVANPDDLTPEQLQLALYRWVAARVLGVDGDRVRAEYRGVSSRNRWVVRRQNLPWGELGGRIERMLGAFAERVRAGRFYPLPLGSSAPCRHCDFRLLCGDEVGEVARRKRGSDPAYLSYWKREGADA